MDKRLKGVLPDNLSYIAVVVIRKGKTNN